MNRRIGVGESYQEKADTRVGVAEWQWENGNRKVGVEEQECKGLCKNLLLLFLPFCFATLLVLVPHSYSPILLFLHLLSYSPALILPLLLLLS